MPPLSRSRHPGPNQLPIPGQEAHPALVHILTPQFLGLEAAEFSDITPEMTDLATADYFKQSLIDVERHGPTATFYKPAGSKNNLWLSLTPEEFKMIPHSLEMLGKTAYNGTLSARSDRPTFGPDKAAAERSRVHIAESKLKKLEPYLQHAILQRLDLVEKFQEMTEHPNLARGNQATVRMRFIGLRTNVLGDIFKAVRVQKDWSEEQADRAFRSYVKRIAFDPSPNARVQSFREMLDLSHEYYGHKRALFLTKIWETKKYIRDNQTNE